jgi:hypothetical protein
MIQKAGRLRNILLICGILASLLFAGADILAGIQWQGYSFISQSISELYAIGAPTRPFAVPLNIAYDVLMIAFGLGVWGLADQKRPLRVTAGLLIGNAAISLIVVAFFPMHLGEAMSTSANIMNVILMFIGMICFLLAIGFGAAAYRNWFRFYSIGTLLAYVVLTILGLFVVPQIAAGQPTLRVGIQERTMVYIYLLWVVMLAIVLWRARDTVTSSTYRG